MLPLRTTTDSKGYYSLTWTPTVSGTHKVYATFDGTQGYWPSSAESTFTVVSAAATQAPLQQITIPPTETYITEAAIAIIVAIAIVGAVIVLMVRKKP